MSSVSSNPTPATEVPVNITISSAQLTAQNIVEAANSVGTIVGTVDPVLLPYVVLAQALDSQIPGLVGAIQAMISGNAPTDSQVAAFKVLNQSLANPASL